MTYWTFSQATKSFESAERFLSKGRNKSDRPLYYNGLRLRKGTNPDELIIYNAWYRFNIAYMYRDGSRVLEAPMITSWYNNHSYPSINSQGVRRLIRELGGLNRVYKEKHICYIVEDDPELTPDKIQKCRSCRGTGKVDAWCSRAIYNDCPHGATKAHTVKAGQKCYRCNGVGTANYGAKPKRMQWDGFPIRVKDGKIVKRKPTLLEMSIANHVQPTS